MDALPACALKVRVCGIDNSEIDIVPHRQGFVGSSTVLDLNERGPVQVSAKGGFIKRFIRPKCCT